jgi:hypothetical protein
MARTYDPELVCRLPAKRPEPVALVNRPEHDEVGDEWLKSAGDASLKEQFCQMLGDSVVLAERTVLKPAGVGDANEER